MIDGTSALKLYAPLDSSPDQERALNAARHWRRYWKGMKQCFVIAGFAGTGKTTLISHLYEEWDHPAVAALCGKAASVLRSKGVEARTIHSLIYIPSKDRQGRMRYRKRNRLPGIETIIIDEASVLDHLTYQDLLSFGLPILAVGDHGQLEPIGTSARLMESPDVCLEQIHRQAEGNPILRLARALRENRRVPLYSDPKGRLRIAKRSEFWTLISPDSQLICGFNRTRHQVNARVRVQRGATGQLPQKGERLICLKNNMRYGVYNGQQAVCIGVGSVTRRWVELEIQTDDGLVMSLPCAIEQFGKDALKEHRNSKTALFDYGYCLTAHKAQGSEWDSVVVLEEISSNWTPSRWRYTAVTRAKERLIYCF
jgi:exodeoxyribonuclease-5